MTLLLKFIPSRPTRKPRIDRGPLQGIYGMNTSSVTAIPLGT
jgi:hypothetical protein